MQELVAALLAFDDDPEIGCMIITGNEKAFAAGADIKQMAGADLVTMMGDSFIDQWDGIRSVKKPIVAAVSGWCLGGGCELAMACDMIIASDTAKFGQPEINLGIIPGAGGIQRLPLAVGKAIAMEMILNDRKLSTQEALQYGLVNQGVPVEEYMDVVRKLAAGIAARAPIAVRLSKKAINQIFETKP